MFYYYILFIAKYITFYYYSTQNKKYCWLFPQIYEDIIGIKLCKFNMYNVMIWYVFVLQNDYYTKNS